MKLISKKTIVAAAICGFLVGNIVPTVNASIFGGLGSILKTGGIAYIVDTHAEDINSFINKLTDKYNVSSDYATKVVPIITVGSKGYVGAAQVTGPQSSLDQCKAALSLEGDMFNRSVRIQALIPIDTKNPLNGFNRVQGVGVSAKIDVAI